MDGYIWYSFGSDTTGPRLADALGYQRGKKAPNFQDFDVVVGFGCKSREPVGAIPGVAEGEVRIINHPDEVDSNRNKLGTLIRLRESNVSVPGLVARQGATAAQFYELVREGLDNGTLAFPIIGNSAHHRGSAYFCYTLEDVQSACVKKATKEEPAVDYFRSFCPGTEFRIHVFRDMAIWAQMKSQAASPRLEAFSALKASLEKKAKKAENGFNITGAAEWVLGEMVDEILQGPSQLLRSTGRGWILEDVNLNEVPNTVVSEAVEAIEAAHLDMGAVSVTFDENVARVTNITTAPAIPDAGMPAYIGAFQEFMEESPMKAVKKKAPAKKESASPELIARLTRKLRGVEASKVEEVLKALG